MNLLQRASLLLLIPLLAAPLASAQKQMRPSSILQYSTQGPDDFIPGDGFMTAGELWNAIKPMNTATPSGVEDPLRDEFIKRREMGRSYVEQLRELLGPDRFNTLPNARHTRV